MLVKNVFQILMTANILGLLYLVFYPLPQYDDKKPHPYERHGKLVQRRLWQNVHGLGHYAHNASSWNGTRHLNGTYRGMELHPIGVKARPPKYKKTSLSRRRAPLFSSISQICVNLSLGSADPGFVDFIRDIRRRNIAPDDEFLRLTEDCAEFKSLRAYHAKPLSVEEEEFPLAYAIYVYKSAHQFEQLLRSIYMPQNYYCVHVDRKSPKTLHEAVRSIGNCFDNVFVIQDPTAVVYRSIGLLRAEMKCLRLLSKIEGWKYYLNLAGQEFPLRTNLEIVRALHTLNGKNDIFSIPQVLPFRQEFLHVADNGFLNMTGERRSSIPPANLTLYYGEAHAILGREFVNFVLEDERARMLLTWLDGTDTPEEHFYSTLNRLPDAPGGCAHHSQSIARAKLWEDGKSEEGRNVRCHSKYVHDICILTTGDLTWLVRQPFFFANKFHVMHDPLVIDCLQEIVGYRTLNPLSVDMKPYGEFGSSRSIGDCLNTAIAFRPKSLFEISRCALEYSYSHFRNTVEQMIQHT